VSVSLARLGWLKTRISGERVEQVDTKYNNGRHPHCPSFWIDKQRGLKAETNAVDMKNVSHDGF
jgi:hypothetical protein